MCPRETVLQHLGQIELTEGYIKSNLWAWIEFSCTAEIQSSQQSSEMTTPRSHSQASCVLVFVNGPIFRIIGYILKIRPLSHGLRSNILKAESLHGFFFIFGGKAVNLWWNVPFYFWYFKVFIYSNIFYFHIKKVQVWLLLCSVSTTSVQQGATRHLHTATHSVERGSTVWKHAWTWTFIRVELTDCNRYMSVTAVHH